MYLLLITGVELKGCVCGNYKCCHGVLKDAGVQFLKDISNGILVIGSLVQLSIACNQL